jgi:hypothetical protein
MKVGNRVIRIDSPEITGVIISLDGGKAKIRWSKHFSQLVDLEKLHTGRTNSRTKTERKNSR